MKVVIVGAGAIGLLIGSYLGQQKHEITYVTRTIEQAQKLKKCGITRIHPNEEMMNVHVEATAVFSEAPTDALWILAVKVHHLEELEIDLRSLPISTPLLFIQNGLSHLQLLERLKQKKIYIATIEHGAMRKDDSTVLHTGLGLTKVAPYKKGKLTKLQVSTFQSPSFKIEVMEDAYAITLRKAVLNACINPITAILHIKNGELITNIQANHLMKSTFEELERAFPEINQSLSFEDVLALCEKTASNDSSMLQDIQNHRKTEIEPIVGALISLAEARNKELPLLTLLFHFVLALEIKGDSSE
ncbi:ketopantoate reductase family protein [Paenisporosarcina indica]|uniref:ketopantoate reductase family protein n=1 Tax=Paenisporosarcina indica TaxID=650093 RepID=UPI00094F5B1D|nr:2-dehydropantoate 2-reductase [Paenisporosarcina indica]